MLPSFTAVVPLFMTFIRRKYNSSQPLGLEVWSLPLVCVLPNVSCLPADSSSVLGYHTCLV